MSPGLKRARAQYKTRNILTGIALFAFSVSVWAYSIAAVKQDVFDDVDEEAKQRAQAEASRATLSVEDERQAMTAAVTAASRNSEPLLNASAPSGVTTDGASSLAKVVQGQPRGVLATLIDKKFPNSGFLDPSRKTLVWGAPPVDSVGKMGDLRRSR